MKSISPKQASPASATIAIMLEIAFMLENN